MLLGWWVEQGRVKQGKGAAGIWLDPRFDRTVDRQFQAPRQPARLTRKEADALQRALHIDVVFQGKVAACTRQAVTRAGEQNW